MFRLSRALAVLVCLGLLAAAGPAAAQARGPFGFLNRLFAPEREVAPPPGEIPNVPRNARPQRPNGQVAPQRKKQAAMPAEPSYPVVDVAPKAPDAKKILVIGDFMAGGLAWGLDQAFADDPSIQILDRSEGSSGFVRDDYYDWAATLPELLDETKPDRIVVLIGSNDRQAIRAADGKFAPRTEEWQKAYQERVGRFLLALQTYGKPVYWVGVPPLKSGDGSADMAYLNTVFKSRAEAVGAHFVDIWDGFADEEGKFIARGPDMDGQARQLRSGDGINFTKSGRRKLAFYVERDIRRDTGVGPAIGTAAPLNPNETTEIGPDGKERKVGPVVSLTDPAPGASAGTLAGAPPPVDTATPPSDPNASAAYKLTVDGVPPPAKPGRADDFSWKPPGMDAANSGSGASVVDGIVLLPAATPPAP